MSNIVNTNYGRDTSCTTSLRSGRFVTGAMLVAESAYRRLTTPRGMLRGGDAEANFGLDLLDLIGSVVTVADAASLPGRIQSELTKDERITEVLATVVSTTVGPVTSYAITIEGQCSAGPFTLQLTTDGLTVELLGITAGG